MYNGPEMVKLYQASTCTHRFFLGQVHVKKIFTLYVMQIMRKKEYMDYESTQLTQTIELEPPREKGSLRSDCDIFVEWPKYLKI